MKTENPKMAKILSQARSEFARNQVPPKTVKNRGQFYFVQWSHSKKKVSKKLEKNPKMVNNYLFDDGFNWFAYSI